MADIWRKILGRKPSEPSNEGEIHGFDQTHYTS